MANRAEPRPLQHDDAARLIQLLTEPKSTVSKANKSQYRVALGQYLQGVKVAVEAPSPAQAEEISRLREAVLKHEAEKAELVPKGALEEAQAEAERVAKEAADAAQSFEQQIAALQEQIAQAKPSVESGEPDPRIAQLTEQVAALESARDEAALKHGEALQELRLEVERLGAEPTRLSREMEAAQLESAQKVDAAQRAMQAHQEVANRVADLPHAAVADRLVQVQAELEKATGQADTALLQALLGFEISLLTKKQAEHEAIQKQLEEASHAGARAALESPEARLEQQTRILAGLQKQMPGRDLLQTPHDQIQGKLEALEEQRQQVTKRRQSLGEVSEQGADKKLEALLLDQAIVNFASQIGILRAMEAVYQQSNEVSRGVAKEGLTAKLEELTAALARETETHRALAEHEPAHERDQDAIAQQAAVVVSLEEQSALLSGLVKQYDEHAASEVVSNSQFLQRLIALVPAHSKGEIGPYLVNAVKAIADLQAFLDAEKVYKPKQKHHTGIGQLVQDFYRWRSEYMGIIRQVINSTGQFGGADFHAVKGQLAGFVEQLVRKQNEMERLLALPQEEVGAELVQARADRRAAVNPVDQEFHDLRITVLETIQAQHHQPLEAKMGIIGTVQRLVVGFFSLLFSIPGFLLGGLQTAGSVLVRNPSK